VRPERVALECDVWPERVPVFVGLTEFFFKMLFPFAHVPSLLQSRSLLADKQTLRVGFFTLRYLP
jgi:hypothetical protein